MLQLQKAFPAVEVPRPEARLGAAGKLLRAALLRAAMAAVQLAARLEKVEPAVGERPVEQPLVRAYWPVAGIGVRLCEALVCLAVAAYYVVGLVGVFVP